MLLCIPHGHQETEDTAGTEEEWGTVLGQGWVGGGALEAFVAKEMTGLSLEC